MGVSEQKRTFLEDALLVNALKTISDSRWDSARRMFKETPTGEKKVKEFKQKCAEFRDTLKSELRNLANEYSSRDVDCETHIRKIRGLAKRMTERHADILNGDKLVFGVAQKVLNVYLKYLWCANLDIRPPHCPFDNDIISALKPTSAFEHRWTHADKEDDYREWVRLANNAAAAEGFRGRLALSEWEVGKWAAIQASNEQRRLKAVLKKTSSGQPAAVSAEVGTDNKN